MNDLQNIKPKRTTFKRLLTNAYKYGFSSQDTDTEFYKQINKLNQYTACEKNVNISQCYLAVDMSKILYKKSVRSQKKHLSKHEVEFITDGEMYSQSLCDYIGECMDNGDVVTISLSLENYIYDHDENTHVTHSVLLLLVPKKQSRLQNNVNSSIEYEMFYINSHGDCMNSTNFHIKETGLNELVTTHFSKPIDFILNELLVNIVNKYNDEYDINATLDYSFTKKNNYLGVNIQGHDNYGCCFIFPILFNVVLHTNYDKYFINQNKRYSIITETTVSQLLESHQIDLFVYHCLAQIDDRMNNYLAKYYSSIRSLEKKQKRRLTRSSLNNIHSSHEELDEELYDDIDDHLDIYKEKFIKSTLNKTMCYVKQNWNNYQPYVLV